MDKSKAIRTEIDILTMYVDPISQLAKDNNWKNQTFSKLIKMGKMKYKLALEENILISSNIELEHSRQTKITQPQFGIFRRHPLSAHA